jgi:SAM-dependent methyltransferase
LAEFTGERVIPGEVDPDLWNEHLARYAFAVRLARNRRVLDAGCGSGYGAAELAREAREVVGIDISEEAIDYARERYHGQRVQFERASCLEIPAADGAFDLVVAFEIIEHLSDWRTFLREARRVLSPPGQFVVSTPNRLYYAESRAQLGPNPFHAHEFDYAEFRSELETAFQRVALYSQNHTDAMVFAPVRGRSPVDSRVEEGGNPEEAHFFVAVCSVSGETSVPGFVYVPRAANMLREREQHIDLLKGWLEESRAELRELLERFRSQTAELEQSNRWAEGLNAQLEERGARVVALQEELAIAGVHIGQLEAEARSTLETATRIARDLEDKCRELAQCVDFLHGVERTVEERTEWAKRAQAAADEFGRQAALFKASRWVRLGRKLRLGPDVERQQ